MRWRGGRRSDNIEDRRGQSAGGGGFGGLGSGRGRIPIRLPRGRRGKLGGLGLLVVIGIALFLGVDPMVLLQGGGMPQMGQQPAPQTQARRTAPQDEMAQFVSVVLADTEDTWHALFRNANRSYKEPKLVLFTGAVNSACGFAQAAMGPFYCPGDQKVYIDLGFFADLRQRFRAPGDFAQAYVIAHEVGHHVQTLLGISRKVHELRGKVSKSEGNKLSVRQELQADCFAGVWAHNADKARKILEKGDIDEALNAASAIGDDRLQKQATGRVVPDSFTHGTSAQRQRWFKRGLKSGKVNDCDTFAAKKL